MPASLPVLALCGLLNDERLWRHPAQVLGADHPFTIVPTTTADSMAALARDALARAPAGRFALAGFSMGGYVALEILRQAPDRVAALAMVDSSARPDTPQASDGRRQAIAAAAKPGGAAAAFASLLPRLLHPDHVARPDLVEALRAMSDAVGVDGFVRQQTANIGRVDSRDLLAKVRGPALVVVGEADAVTPPDVAREMADGIPGARLVVVPQAGHMTLLEQPDAVTDALRAWLVEAVAAEAGEPRGR